MKTISLTYVIEDDEIASFLIQKSIEEHPGFEEFSFFKNGEYALKKIQSDLDLNDKTPDLIILDLTMSIMDGWEFLEELKNLNQQFIPPVVVLTSSIDNRDIEKAKNNPYVLSYFSKPLDKDKLDVILKHLSI